MPAFTRSTLTFFAGAAIGGATPWLIRSVPAVPPAYAQPRPSGVSDEENAVIRVATLAAPAFLGVSYNDVEVLATQLRLPVSAGVVVTGVARGSPAAGAGLRPGDIITAINDTPVKRGADLRRALRAARPGSDARLTVVRGTDSQVVPLELGEMTR